MNEQEKMHIVKGIPGAPGIVFGKALVIDRKIARIPRRNIHPDKIEQEVERLHRALETSKQQLLETKARIDQIEGKEHIFILETHLMIMDDQVVIEDIVTAIRNEKINAEWALKTVFDRLKRVFDNIDDEYLRNRKDDLDHISRRILQNLMGVRREGLPDTKEQVILISHALSPADMAHIDRNKVFGIATDIGGETSHVTILARAMDIPTIVGLEDATAAARTGDMVILDGLTGTLVVHPTPEVTKKYRVRERDFQRNKEELMTLRDLPAKTKDGHKILLSANIELPEEIPPMLKHGVRSIGLFRSEYIFLTSRKMPSEEQHYKLYKDILERVRPHPATIRTLDVGGEKFLELLELPNEANPALGLRAIRFCLREREMFKSQLRALLRASPYGKLRIMFPMISSLEELREAKELLEEARGEVESDGVEVDPELKVGIMMETPSAAMVADLLAREVDFFSIGTNDLIQYAMAIDRGNEHVSYLYNPLHPALPRLIKRIVDAGHAEGIEVVMCGEMAGEPLYLPLLVGFGLDELSMNTISVLKVKRLLRQLVMPECREFAEHVLTLGTTREVEEFVKGEMARRYPEVLPQE